MRLFIATPVLNFDYTIIKKDFGNCIFGNWTKEINLHLTWSFLGEVDDQKEIIKRLKNITALKSNIPIKGLGYFGLPPKVFFANVDDRLLQDKLKEFKSAGFNVDRFKAHITLSRIKSICSSSKFNSNLKKYQNIGLGALDKTITLYKSTLTPNGPIYTKIYEIS